MKGITAVIAIILLLLITISMVGFAFVWFQRVAQISTDTATTQLTTQLNATGQKILIDNIATNGNITLRHAGSSSTDTSLVGVYVDSAKITCAWDVPGAWSVGAFKSCTVVDGFTCTGTTKVEVSTPGNRDSKQC